MESLNFHKIKLEKANAMLRYKRRQNVTILFRFIEFCIFFAIISRFSTRLPLTFKLSIECFKGLGVTLISPRFVFVLGNVIVIILFLKSGHSSAKDGSTNNVKIDLYDEYKQKCSMNYEQSKKQSILVENAYCEQSKKQSILEKNAYCEQSKKQSILVENAYCQQSKKQSILEKNAYCEQSKKQSILVENAYCQQSKKQSILEKNVYCEQSKKQSILVGNVYCEQSKKQGILEKNAYCEQSKKQSILVENAYCEQSKKQRKQSILVPRRLVEKKLNRSHSESFTSLCHDEKPRKELIRSATVGCLKVIRTDNVKLVDDEMSSEEFRNTVEAFIARQQRFLREEELFSDVVST